MVKACLWQKMSKVAALGTVTASTFFLCACRSNTQEEKAMKPVVKLGLEVLVEKQKGLIAGKKVGLATNITGVDSRLRSSVDVIAGLPDVELVALYGPEHGVRGGVQGEVSHGRDIKTGVPVYSLYGATRRPTAEMLKNIEVFIFDLQDIGTRSYTYISTLKLCLEESARHKIKFIVLDRPNPLGGLLVDGPVLKSGFESFIGAGPIPYVHGMTIGELANFFNEEMKIGCELKVIPMEGWRRQMFWEDTGLIWTPTSPNIPEPDSPWFYPVTGIIGELGLVSVGIGYTLPFKVFGAPWMEAKRVAAALNSKKLPGVWFQEFYFSPTAFLFRDNLCQGCRIIITDPRVFKPVASSYHIIETLSSLYPEKFNLTRLDPSHAKRFDNVNGTEAIRKRLSAGEPAEKIIQDYQLELEEFLKKRQKYLLYR
ncbi:MAG: DUF1343 domain-containing protein [Candidatus Omnitrophica bacterium]|nr:DUF1343 domain-containing protein [Candidatus Omnitrophota bacterium]